MTETTQAMEFNSVLQCSCTAEIEKRFPDHMLNTAMFSGRVLIDLIRRDNWKRETRRGKIGHAIASYCPFCGTKYEKVVSGIETVAKEEMK